MPTCQVSLNFRESPEISPDLQVSRKCEKNSRISGYLREILIFRQKELFFGSMLRNVGLGVPSRGMLRARKRIEGFGSGKTLPLPPPPLICDGFVDRGIFLYPPPPPLNRVVSTEKTQEIPQAQLGSSGNAIVSVAKAQC